MARSWERISKRELEGQMASPAHVESIIMHEHENRRTEQQHDALPTFCTIQLVNYARIGYSSAVGMFFSFKKQNTFFLGGGD